MLEMRQIMLLRQICPCCKQPITGEGADENARLRRLFGSEVNISVCVHCQQSVDEETQKDKKYRRRWHRRARQRVAERLRQMSRQPNPPFSMLYWSKEMARMADIIEQKPGR